MKIKTRNVLLCLMIFALVLCCGFGLFFGTGMTTASAASNTNIQTFTGTETVTHKAASSNATTYSESYSYNTGIKIYGLLNTGTSSSGNEIKVDGNSLTIDFSNASALYTPKVSSGLYMGKDETGYSFQILSGSTVKWYATFTRSSYTKEVTENGETTTKTYYKKTINVNGKSTTTNSESDSYHSFVVSDFGSNIVNLSDGSYAIKIVNNYSWTNWESIFKICSYSSTSTLTGTLIVDTTSPTVAMKGYTSGSTISGGAYKNERVTFTASDTNHYHLYYKTPTASAYTYTTSNTYTSGTTNGWYYVYAQDKLGNKSAEYSFYYDSTKPTGTIYSNGTSVASGSYVSKSFSYSATDGGSGVSKLYYKTPTSGVYQQYSSGTIIPANAGDGWYYFYAVDNAGNQSATSQVYLETEAPLVEIYRNGTLAYSKTVTAAGTFDTEIYLNPNDVIRVSCDTSSGKVTSNISLDTNITIGSSYTANSYTIELTTATGIKSNFIYHIVRSKPVIKVGGTTYQSGATLHLNADTLVSWDCDSVITSTENTGMSISSEGGVNINEFLKYTDGKSKTLTTPAGTTAKYELTLNDRAGNESNFIIYIDKEVPEGEWRTNGGALENGGYTNKSLNFVFTESGVSATYSYNGGEYAPYKSGQSFTADGTYIVVLTDLANNKSTYTAHIDTVAPVGQLYANYKQVGSGAITNGSVYFTWDGDATATVNGQPYTKNTVITADGIYRFVLTDFAGNKSEYLIEIDTVKASDNMNRLGGARSYTVAKWYVVDFDGETKAFATYESALEYACQREFAKFVTSLELNDVNDFTQYHLIASRGNPADDVREGTYWRYKSQANANSELYYFDRELLDEIIAFYAQSYVSGVNYFTLEGDKNYDELADDMYDNVWTADDGTQAPCVNGFTFEQTDSVAIYAQLVGSGEGKVAIEFGKPFDEQVFLTGLYEITEVDGANNINIYYVFLDNTAPTMKVEAEVFGENETRELTITADTAMRFNTYYYKTFAIKQLVDNDTWVTLKIENGNKAQYYSYGDRLPVLNIGGEYLITVYDRLGNAYSFTVYIVGNEATVNFKPNSDNTAFEISIALEQKFDTLVVLEIYRNGEPLSGISTDIFKYTFDKAGYYTVTMRDNFGRVITRNFDFSKSLPNGTLVGVENGGRTASEAGFTFDNTKYYVEVSKDGVVYATDKTGDMTITADGKYEIKLINLTDEENFRIYTFEIDTVAPAIMLKGGVNGKTTNGDVTVTWTDTDVQTATYTLNGGEETVFENGTKFTTEGIYILTVTDDLGNKSTVMFTIDKTLDYTVLIDDTEAMSEDTTNKNISVINHEELYVTVTRNGKTYEFEFGQILSEEGVYAFRIYDDFGNTATFTLVIDKSVDFSATTGNGVITNDDVIITAAEKVNVFATKDGAEYSYTLGTAITEEGAYKFTVYDSYGNEKTVSFQIVKGTKTKLDYMLGENVVIKSIMHDGEAVSADGNRLNFTVDGVYTVVCKVDDKEYSFELALDTTAPTITLNGIEDGGKGNVTVTITDLSEAGTVEVYKDGEKIEYNLGDELKEYGSYEVRVSDELGNERVYTFTLEYQMNGGAIALIVIGILLAAGVVVAVIFGKKAIYKKKGGTKSEMSDDSEDSSENNGEDTKAE